MKMSTPRLTKYAATAKPMMVPICRGLTRRIRTMMNTRTKSARSITNTDASRKCATPPPAIAERAPRDCSIT